MSFVKPNLTNIVKKQYLFKLKAFYSVFTTLIVLQILALLFSFMGVGTSGGGSAGIQVYVNYYSADIVVVFTMLWAFITSILITTKAYRSDDFTFITNRVSQHLSNVLFLLTASLIGGLTAMFSRYLLQVIVYYISDTQILKDSSLFDAPLELLLGLSATCLYMLLFSGLGYFSGMLVQLNKLFVVLLPGAFIGTMMLGAKMRNGEGNAVFEFFAQESSFTLFLVKVVIITVFLFMLAIAMSNRLEVRQ